MKEENKQRKSTKETDDKDSDGTQRSKASEYQQQQHHHSRHHSPRRHPHHHHSHQHHHHHHHKHHQRYQRQPSQASHMSPRQTELISPNQSPLNQNQTYHQQQQLHQQQIQRTGGLHRLTADIAGLQFNEADTAIRNQTNTSPPEQPKQTQPIKLTQRGSLKTMSKSSKTWKFVNNYKQVFEANVNNNNNELANNESPKPVVESPPNNQALAATGGGGYEEQMAMKSSTGSQGSGQDPVREAQETAEDAAILKRFKVIQLVGVGNYARVYKAISSNNKELAIKSINLSKTSDNYRQKFLPRELTILKRISHINICKIHEIMQIADRVYIVMQFCSRGTIADLLHKVGPLSEPISRNLIIQVLDAVNYMHSLDLAHRDLKVENILLDNDYIPKLTDFSYSSFIFDKNSLNTGQQQVRHLKGLTTNNNKTAQMSSRSIKLNETFCGTLPYLSPEMIRQYPYDPRKTDIWSLGVCLYVMLNDRLPFPFNDIKTMVKKQLSKDFKFRAHSEFSDQVKDLVSLMLEPDHLKRPFCHDLLRHSWFNGPREKPAN